MEIIDKFKSDIEDLYDFEHGLSNERYLELKETELPILESKIELCRGISKNIKNEIIEKNIATHFISSYLVDFKNMLYRIKLLTDRLEKLLQNNQGDRLFTIVSKFKLLSWMAKKEIQEILYFLEQVPAPPSPKDTNEEYLQKVADQLRQKNREMNKPPVETRGFKSNLADDKLELLFDWLVKNKYLDLNSDKTFFVQAFGGHLIDMNSKNKLIWVDHPVTNQNYINSQTIFQLLESLGIKYDADDFIPEIQNQIQKLFKNELGNLKGKHKDFLIFGGRQLRQKLISEYITTLLKP